MRRYRWMVLIIIIAVLAVLFVWNNLYSQEALGKRISFQKGFEITQQDQVIEVNFVFQPAWIPEMDENETKQINHLVYQDYSSSVYLTSIFNHYDRNSDGGHIIASFEIKQNFNTKGGSYVSCYSVSERGFTPTIGTVTGYDNDHKLLDEDFGSVAGIGAGETFSIYLKTGELLDSPINIKIESLNLIQYVKD